MTKERQALVDAVDTWGEQTRLSMAEAECVEPDEQVRSLGDTSLCFANWQLAVIELGNYDREHPEEDPSPYEEPAA